MAKESKGRGWYDKIYRKFETILVEVDTSASQGTVSLESDNTHKLAEDHCSGSFDSNHPVELPRCESPSEIPSDQSEQMEGDRLKEKLSDTKLIDEKMLSTSSLLEQHNDCNQTTIACNDDTLSPSGISTDKSNLILLTTEIKERAFTSNSVKGGYQDEFFIEDSDAAPWDTIDLYDMTFREDPSDFDDNLLYAARDRTRQLRSFKRKIMDKLTSKRRREKEYEQLAIWFGDADMGCDLINTKEHATTTSLDCKSSQSNTPEDSEWELL